MKKSMLLLALLTVFIMPLAAEEISWSGSWISDSNDREFRPAPRFRKEVLLSGQPVKAVAYLATGGLSTLLVNGKVVDETRVLDPAFTRYDRRVLVSTFDITDKLKEGNNCIGVELGNGWYNHQSATTWHFDRAPWRDRPTFCLDVKITYSDGREEMVTSDADWKTSSDGPVRFNNIYVGEHHDFRRGQTGWASAGYDATLWDAVKLRSCPTQMLTIQNMPPIRESAPIEAVKITQLRPTKWVYDFGENMAGNVLFTAQGQAGTVITLKYSERLMPVEGRADQSNIDCYYFGDNEKEPFQTDIVTLSGGIDEYHPRYSYKGFRYVEVTASSPVTIKIHAVKVHSDVKPNGSVSCSDPVIQAIWEATNRSYLSNLMGYPTDCPQREKNGWTGDGHIAVETGLFNFDVSSVYEKWLADHRDEQQPNGVLPDIIPTPGWGYWSPKADGNGLDWTSTIALIPWELYLFYDDIKHLSDCYYNIKRYVDYALSLSRDGLVCWGRGDWVPVTKKTGKTLICSCFLYKDLEILSEASRLCGHPEDYEKYSSLAKKVRQAINDKFLDKTTGRYADGMQTAQSLPLYFGVTPKENVKDVAAALAERVKEDKYHVNAGVHGAKAVLHALSANGYGEMAYKMASATDFPSWGYWIKGGRTTLSENWRLDAGKDNSDNHVMFGDISAWFYRSLGGINPDPEQPGFKHIILRPIFPHGMKEFSCSYTSKYGRIVSGWQRKGAKVEYQVTIPEGCIATLITEDGTINKLTAGTQTLIF